MLFIGILNLKILFLMTKDILELPTLVLREFGGQTMLKTPVVLLATWVNHSIALNSIFSPWGYVQTESWSCCWLFCCRSNRFWVHVRKGMIFALFDLNVLFSDPTLESQERRFETTFSQSRSRLRDLIFLEAGLLKRLISSIK